MSYTFFTADDLRAIAAREDAAKLFRSRSERFWVNEIVKDHAPSVVAEMHDTEADIYLTLEGEADLYLGGAIVDANSPQPGQTIGTGLQGATCRRLAQGDLVIIPEGVPHLVDARASRIVYLVVKQDIAAGAP